MSQRSRKRLQAFFQVKPNSLLSGGLLGLLLLFYIASVYILVTVLSTFPFGKQPSQSLFPDGRDWGVYVVTTIVVALTFLPVSRWLNDRVNDLVYAQDDATYDLVAAINRLLGTMDNPSQTLSLVVETIAEGLHLDYACLEVQAVDETAPEHFSYGSPPTDIQPVVYPITYLDQPVGNLSVVGRVGKRPLSASDCGFFEDIASQLGIALHVARLTSDLRHSRERLVTAREEERRRIRNDLHDDLAPTLSSFQMQLAAARNLLRTNSEQAEAIIRELSEDLRHAMGDIRDLVYDLRPPLLDELGLVGAIESLDLSDSPLHLEVISPASMPPLSAAVEVAVFRIVKEAVQNARIHGQAERCTVSLTVEAGQFIVGVIDDGSGLDPDFTPGIGLRSMRERAAELEGSVTIRPAPSSGTWIEARLPLGK